jgi:hypothetical protein
MCLKFFLWALLRREVGSGCPTDVEEEEEERHKKKQFASNKLLGLSVRICARFSGFPKVGTTANVEAEAAAEGCVGPRSHQP